MIEIAILCDMSQTFHPANEFRPETKTRTLPAINAKPESEDWQSVCRRSRKSKVHPTVKKLTAWRKLNRLSQRKAVVVLAPILFPCHFRFRSEAGRKDADRQIHILPPFSKNSCSTIRPLSEQKNEPTHQHTNARCGYLPGTQYPGRRRARRFLPCTRHAPFSVVAIPFGLSRNGGDPTIRQGASICQ